MPGEEFRVGFKEAQAIGAKVRHSESTCAFDTSQKRSRSRERLFLRSTAAPVCILFPWPWCTSDSLSSSAFIMPHQVVLGDRHVNITLKRTWAALSTWQRIKFIWCLIYSGIAVPDADELEQLLKDLKVARLP